MKKTTEEIRDWLLNNAVDLNGNLIMTGLDFSDFDGNVYIDGIKVKRNLIQSYQEVKGDLYQRFHKVKGGLYQDKGVSKMKKTIKDLKEYLLENFVDDFGDLAIRGLDFSDFDGDVVLTQIKVKNDLYQGHHKVKGNISQGYHEVEGDLFQSFNEVKGDLYQEKQKVGGKIYQDKIAKPPEISERAKSVLRLLKSNYLEYYLAKDKDGKVFLYDIVPERHKNSWERIDWEAYDITLFLKEPLADYDWKNEPIKVKDLIK